MIGVMMHQIYNKLPYNTNKYICRRLFCFNRNRNKYHHLPSSSSSSAAAALLYSQPNIRNFGGSVSSTKSINKDNTDDDDDRVVWVTTRNSLANRRIVHELGVVSAVAFRSKHIFMDFWAAIVGMFGGEIVTYTDLMSQCANESAQRVRDIASDLGATSVVNLRYETTSTMNRLIVGIHCSVYCYGTAVIDEPIDADETDSDHQEDFDDFDIDNQNK